MQTESTPANNPPLTPAQLGAVNAFWEALEPDPVMAVSEWAGEYRYLGETASAEPGRWRNDRTPFLREIMDALSAQSPYQDVIFIKGAQIGGTESGMNWLGYIIDYAPGPALAVQPTVDIAKRFSKQRVAPLISGTPRLTSKVRDSRTRDSGNTVLSKEFPGGILLMTGANSAAGLRSMPVRYLFLDEIDAYPDDVDGEGDPIELAEARTRTFARRKRFKCSTPTFEGRSKIARAYEASDQRRYWVPCPHCNEKQVLKWSQVRWPKGEPHAAVYVCEHCREEIQEHNKTWMFANGCWRADKPGAGNGKIAGFMLSSLYSPIGWFSWGDAAAMWEGAQGSPDKLRVFVNTVLGETWKEKSVQPDYKRLYERTRGAGLERNKLEPWVLFLTAGVDVQADRLEVEVVGWGRRKRSQSVDYRVLPGDTSDLSADGPWQQLRALLDESWAHPVAGVALNILSMAIDSGYNTQTVYSFCREFEQPRVFPVKGSDSIQSQLGTPKFVDINHAGRKIRRGVAYWPVGSSVIKTELYGWLNQALPDEGEELPIGWCDFPEYDQDHFKGLTAEQLVVRISRGYRVYQWEKTRERNEQVDCRAYSRAAASLVGLDRWQETDYQEKELFLGIGRAKTEAKPVNVEKRNGVAMKKSDFWAGR